MPQTDERVHVLPDGHHPGAAGRARPERDEDGLGVQPARRRLDHAEWQGTTRIRVGEASPEARRAPGSPQREKRLERPRSGEVHHHAPGGQLGEARGETVVGCDDCNGTLLCADALPAPIDVHHDDE